MDIRHFTINISPEECGHARADKDGADLTAYLLSPISCCPQRRRPAVIICPGGGYAFTSDREDQAVAMQFLSMGCQTFVLHYHVAPEHFPVALMELARSTALVRDHADEWNIDPKAVLVCGFSAGGHLACSLGVFWNRKFLFQPLGLAPEQIRPDGMILSYPVITSGAYAHQDSFLKLLGEEHADDPEKRLLVSLEEQVTPETPPVFLWHTWNDGSVPVENSLLLAQALKKAGVSLEMHIYPEGRHGLSLATEEVSAPDGGYIVPHCQNWIRLAEAWIRDFFKNR